MSHFSQFKKTDTLQLSYFMCCIFTFTIQELNLHYSIHAFYLFNLCIWYEWWWHCSFHYVFSFFSLISTVDFFLKDSSFHENDFILLKVKQYFVNNCGWHMALFVICIIIPLLNFANCVLCCFHVVFV